MARSSMIALLDYTDGLSDASKETDDKEQKEILEDAIDEDKKNLSIGVEWIYSSVGFEDFKDSAMKFFDTVLSFFKNLFGQITTLVVSDLKTINAAIERWDKLKNNITVTKPYELEIAKDGKACFSFAGLDWLSKRAPILYELQKAMSASSPDIEKSIQELPDTSTTDDDIAKVQSGSAQVVTYVRSLYDGLNKAVAGKWFDNDVEVFPQLRYKADVGNDLPTLQVPTGKADTSKIEQVKLKYYLAVGTKSNIEKTYIEKELATHKTFLEITNKVCADLRRIIESSSKDLAKVKKLFLSLQSQTKTKNQAQAQGTTSPTPNPAQGKTGYVAGGLEAARSDANDKNAVGQRAGAKLLACIKAWQRPAQLICTCCQKTIGDLRVSFKVASAAMDHFSAGAKTDEKKEETATTTPQQGKTASMDDLLRLTPMARHMTVALGGSYLIEESEEDEDNATLVWKEIEHYFDMQSNDLRSGTEGFLDSILEFFAGFFKAIGTFFDRLFGGSGGGGGGSCSATADKTATLLSSPATKEAIKTLEKAIATDPDFLKTMSWPFGRNKFPSADAIKRLLTEDYTSKISEILDGGEPIFRRVDDWATLFDQVASVLKSSTNLDEKSSKIKQIADAIGPMKSEGKKAIDDLIIKASAGAAVAYASSTNLKNVVPTVSRDVIIRNLGGLLTGVVDAAELSKLLTVLKDGEQQFNKLRASVNTVSARKDKLMSNLKPKVEKLTKGLENLVKTRDETLQGFSSRKDLTSQVTKDLDIIKKAKSDLVASFNALLKCITVPVSRFNLSCGIIGAAISFIHNSKKVAESYMNLNESLNSSKPTPNITFSWSTEDLFGHEDYSLLDPQVYDFFEVEVGLEDSDDGEFFLIRWVKWIWKKITDFFDWLFGSDSEKKEAAATDKTADAGKTAAQACRDFNLDEAVQSGDPLILKKGTLNLDGFKAAPKILQGLEEQVKKGGPIGQLLKDVLDTCISAIQVTSTSMGTYASTRDNQNVQGETSLNKAHKAVKDVLKRLAPSVNTYLDVSVPKEYLDPQGKYRLKSNIDCTKDIGYAKQLLSSIKEEDAVAVAAKAKAIFMFLRQTFSKHEQAFQIVLRKVEKIKMPEKLPDRDKDNKPTDPDKMKLDKKMFSRAKQVQALITSCMKLLQKCCGEPKKITRDLLQLCFSSYTSLSNVLKIKREKKEAKDAENAAKNGLGGSQQQQQQQGQQTAWFEPGLLDDDVKQFEFTLESFKGVGTESILDSVLGLLTGLANMVSRLFSTFKMIYRSFKDLKRTELHSYQEKYPASIFRVKRLSYQELSDVDVPLPKGLKTTYQDALQKTLTVLRACDMKTRSKAFVSVAKKLVSQLKTGIDTRTTTGGLYTQEQEVKQINNLFKKADQCFDGASATSKKFKALFTSTEEFSTVHDLLDDGCQYEYEVASVYSNLQECEELMNEAVAHAKSRKSLGNIPISKAELVSLSETCLFMAKTFDMYGLAVANFNKIEHNYVETLKAIMRKFDI